MSQQLRTHTGLGEDSNLVLSGYQTAHNHLYLQLQESSLSSLASEITNTHVRALTQTQTYTNSLK